MINPRPGSSVYEQLAARLRDDIQAGRLQPGNLLPSEVRLAQEHDLSRVTVNRAMKLLRAEGLVDLERGIGHRVRDHRVMSDYSASAGSAVTARMPTAEERAEFGLREGVPVLVVTPARGVPMVVPADRWRVVLDLPDEPGGGAGEPTVSPQPPQQ